MLKDLEKIDWSSYPQPEWNEPDSVQITLRALAAAVSEEAVQEAYHGVLYALGNDHAGTYYPVVLPALPFIREILERGRPEASAGALEVLVDLLVSFCPEPGHELASRPDGSPVGLDVLVLEAVADMLPAVEAMKRSATTENQRASIRDIISCFQEQGNDVSRRK